MARALLSAAKHAPQTSIAAFVDAASLRGASSLHYAAAAGRKVCCHFRCVFALFVGEFIYIYIFAIVQNCVYIFDFMTRKKMTQLLLKYGAHP